MGLAIEGRADVYTVVTERIIEALERGVKPWRQPWGFAHAAGPASRPLRVGGEPYRGVNVLLLWASAAENDFESPYWMTFRQAKELGGCVKAGSKGSPVVYSSSFAKTEADENGDETRRGGFFLKRYTVFNTDQIDGLPDRFHARTEPRLDESQRIERADAFCSATGAEIRHQGDSASYSPALDIIRMPRFERFETVADYYSTLMHELTHWTGHKGRLDRTLVGATTGDANYAREELIAELGAAFLCADLDLEPVDRQEHASYLDHWLKALRADKRFIVAVASQAQKAADYLHGLQPKAESR